MLDALVDRLDPGGDVRPGVALGAATRRLPHRLAANRFDVHALKLLGEALGVRGRDEDAVDVVGDDVGVAGDVGGDHRGPGGERLGEDHPEALTGERRRDQHVGAGELVPELGLAEAAERVDVADRGGIGDVARDVGLLDPDDAQP
jgi:hypothetical protein